MKYSVLIADDLAHNVRLLSEILADEGFETVAVSNGPDVLPRAAAVEPDLILLDIMMPGLDGFDVCGLLKADEKLRDIPVIMVTARTDGADVRRALELGAFDYIRKPIDENEVVARVRSALKFKEQLDLMKLLAMKDSLTGLYNHVILIELLEKMIARQKRDTFETAFIMADIDRFKSINDTYGHQAGDEVLRAVAAILKRCVRESDIVGRYGGEEFGLIIGETSGAETAVICERIREAVERHEFVFDGRTVGITISLGFFLRTHESTADCRMVIANADEALYTAKKSGRNRVVAYGSSLQNP